MKKKIILLLIITIFIPHVRALELNVCTESEAHKAWNELDESIKSTFIEPSFVHLFLIMNIIQILF